MAVTVSTGDKPTKPASTSPKATTGEDKKLPARGLGRLMKARQEFGNIAKNKSNPFFSSKYVDLAGVIEHTFGTLASNDILVQQTLISTGELEVPFPYVLQTSLYDTTTENLLDSMVYPIICKDYKDPQKVGGALTYARRYSLLTILGLAAEDDDGNLASQPSKEPKEPKEAKETKEAGPSKANLVAEIQRKFGVKDADDLKALTSKVFGEKKAVTTFAVLEADDLNVILNSADVPAM